MTTRGDRWSRDAGGGASFRLEKERVEELHVSLYWGVPSLHLGQCAWPALVGWRFLCVCAFDGFLLWFRIAYACPTTASLCNILLLILTTCKKYIHPSQFVLGSHLSLPSVCCVCVPLVVPALVPACLCILNHRVCVTRVLRACAHGTASPEDALTVMVCTTSSAANWLLQHQATRMLMPERYPQAGG